ncbi:MAG: hypothetical protein ACM3X4_12410 [Ignavibacteriales bacterium]
MDIREVLLTVLHGWLEFMAIAAAGMVSWDIKFDARRLALIGVIGTVAAQLARAFALPVKFGLHTIILMFVLLPMIYFMFKPPFWMASSATFGGFTLFLLVEEMVLIYIVRVRGVHIEEVLADIRARAVFGMIAPLVLAIYCLVVLKIRRSRRERLAGKAHPLP